MYKSVEEKIQSQLRTAGVSIGLYTVGNYLTFLESECGVLRDLKSWCWFGVLYFHGLCSRKPVSHHRISNTVIMFLTGTGTIMKYPHLFFILTCRTESALSHMHLITVQKAT